VTFCIRCSEFNCGGSEGLISISVSPTSSVRPLDDKACSNSTSQDEYIPGPGLLSVSVTAYAFGQGEDKWLSSRCKGSAQASQTNIQRYDATTDKWWLLPSKVHRAQIQGVIGSCSLKHVFFTGSIAESQIANGASITTEMGLEIGAELTYNGAPMEITIPDLEPYTISLGGDQLVGYISSFSVSVDFPNPATCSYTFELPIEGD
jgi:hypothetical protein